MVLVLLPSSGGRGFGDPARVGLEANGERPDRFTGQPYRISRRGGAVQIAILLPCGIDPPEISGGPGGPDPIPTFPLEGGRGFDDPARVGQDVEGARPHEFTAPGGAAHRRSPLPLGRGWG